MVHIENKVVFYTLNSMRETVYAIQLCMGVCVYIYIQLTALKTELYSALCAMLQANSVEGP